MALSFDGEGGTKVTGGAAELKDDTSEATAAEEAKRAAELRELLETLGADCDKIVKEKDLFREENADIVMVLDMFEEKLNNASSQLKDIARELYLLTNKSNKGALTLLDLENFMINVGSGGWAYKYDLAAWRKANKKKATDFPDTPFFVKQDPKFDPKKYEESAALALKNSADISFEEFREHMDNVNKEPKTPKVTLGHPDEVLTKKDAQARAMRMMSANGGGK